MEFIFSVQVELTATTKDPGTALRAPTSEAGLASACKDTCYGELRLQIWERRYDGTKGKVGVFVFLLLKDWISLLILTKYCKMYCQFPAYSSSVPSQSFHDWRQPA